MVSLSKKCSSSNPSGKLFRSSSKQQPSSNFFKLTDKKSSDLLNSKPKVRCVKDFGKLII